MPEGDLWTVHAENILPFLMSEQHHDIYEFPGHEVRPGDIVLDCGADIGVFSRKALSRGARLVVAIEPAPQTLNAPEKNLQSDIRAGRVIIYPKGVWDKDGELELTVNESNQGSNSVVLSLQTTGTVKVKVPLTTIDHIVKELHLPGVDFIKMDLEGAEKSALTGASETLAGSTLRCLFHPNTSRMMVTAIPKLVNSIEPTYAVKRCDCVADERQRVKPLVLEFTKKA